MEQNEEIKFFEECPNCAEGDNRWVYICDDCGFEGCWDEIHENGCFELELESPEVVCPDCGSMSKTKTGQVNAGTEEE